MIYQSSRLKEGELTVLLIGAKSNRKAFSFLLLDTTLIYINTYKAEIHLLYAFHITKILYCPVLIPATMSTMKQWQTVFKAEPLISAMAHLLVRAERHWLPGSQMGKRLMTSNLVLTPLLAQPFSLQPHSQLQHTGKLRPGWLNSIMQQNNFLLTRLVFCNGRGKWFDM